MVFLPEAKLSEIFMKVFVGHPHWRGVQEVADRLQQNGFQAWLAGGCVRDLLLSRVPNDFDIATDARPEQVEALFERSVSVGKAFGVIVIPFADFQIEIATFRSDGEYLDGRRPESVVFSSPEEDAKRRDFTINALYFDLKKKQVIDFVDGISDLEKGLIRCVGDPLARFGEDQLRVLRAARFAAQLGFSIENETWQAIKARASFLNLVSAERVREELGKLLLSANPMIGLQLLEFSGLWGQIFPSWSMVSSGGLSWTQIKGSLVGGKPTSLVDCWLLLLERLIENEWPNFSQMKDQVLVAEVRKVSQEIVRRYLDSLKYSNGFYKQLAEALSAEKLKAYKGQLRRGCQMQVWGGELPLPWLKGSDLKEIGFKPGPLFSEVLQEAYLRQLEGIDSSKADQIKWASSKI